MCATFDLDQCCDNGNPSTSFSYNRCNSGARNLPGAPLFVGTHVVDKQSGGCGLSRGTSRIRHLSRGSAVGHETQMSKWLPDEAIAMERRHILAGEKIILRQEALTRNLTEHGRGQLLHSANEVLSLLRESLELSRVRLRDLEDRYSKMPTPNEE